MKFSILKNFCRESKAGRSLGITLAALSLPLIYFFTELYNYKTPFMFFRFVYYHPGSALLGLLIVSAVTGIFIAATRRMWVGCLVGGSFFQICGIIHLIKTALNGDPFVPWDITMAGQMGELMRFVDIDFPLLCVLLPALLALLVFGLWLFDVKLPKGLWYRIAVCAAMPVLLVGFIVGGQDNFERFGMTYMDAALQSSNYRANGLVGAFYLNIATMQVEEPEGYDEQTASGILTDHSDTEGKTPDVIVILCESFWDIRKLPGTTFSKDPLAGFDAICARENAFDGTLYSTAIGGGTVRTEFGVLTGLSADYLPSGASPYIYVKNDFPTHVSHFKELGYTTTALHPYDKKFYTRSAGYPYVGFDAFYGQEEIEGQVEVTYERGYVSDDSFVDALINQLENTEGKTFLWGISMENHQTYLPPTEPTEITLENKALSQDVLGAATTYTQGVYHSVQALEKLVDYIDKREKETLLVFFGDHLPTLGADHAAYKATGYFDGVGEETEERKRMYGTPFLIYSNYGLEKIDAPTEVSDYNLLSLATELGGVSRSAFMNWQWDTMQRLPYYNNRLGMKKTKEVKAFIKEHRFLTYDRLIGGQYSEK